MSGYRRPFRAYPYSVLCNPLGQHAVPPLPFPAPTAQARTMPTAKDYKVSPRYGVMRSDTVAGSRNSGSNPAAVTVRGF